MDEEQLVKRDDGLIALTILAVAIVLTIILGLRFFKSPKKAVSVQHSSFTPPPEREAFLEAQKQLDPSKLADGDELKKLLMKRAIKTIPILLQLQNEGSSIERLYKKGMLTDDMHLKMKEMKAFVDQEFNDIKAAADDLLQGWGEQIWPQAMQFHQVLQKQLDSLQEEQAKKNEPETTNNTEEQQSEHVDADDVKEKNADNTKKEAAKKKKNKK